MLFVFSLVVRALIRLLVLPSADDGTKDLEILVLRHQWAKDFLKLQFPEEPSSTTAFRRQIVVAGQAS